MLSTRIASPQIPQQIPRKQLPSQKWPPLPTLLINQLGKYSLQIVSHSKLLRRLLSTKHIWSWGPDQEDAFARVKAEMAMYNPMASTKVSSYGLGAVLFQQTTQEWRTAAYASSSMTDTETSYAQFKKEAQLSLNWACEKLSPYILGMTVQLETDHKPLLPLLNHTHLDNLPLRALRFVSG